MDCPELDLVNELISKHLIKVSFPDLDTIFDHHFLSPGKQIRPLVTLKLAECFGSDPKKIAPWAALCEALHNGTLIHDDLQDGDTVRRNKPTVWKKFGALQAINAGDMLLLSPPMFINTIDASDSIKWKLSLIYSQCSTRIVYGQALEPSLINYLDKPELSKLYYECIGAKTGELFKMCALGVGVILELPPQETQSLANLWFNIGIVFQIQDDLLDIFGDKGRQEVYCDLREGKVSSLIVELLISKPDLSDEIFKILSTPRGEITDKHIKSITDLFDSENVREKLLDKIEDYRKGVLSDPLNTNNKQLLKFSIELFDKILEPISGLN